MEEIGGNVDINQLSLLNFKNPNTSMVLSILGTGVFGIDRFYMGDIGLRNSQTMYLRRILLVVDYRYVPDSGCNPQEELLPADEHA
jgi:hypothetical protein